MLWHFPFYIGSPGRLGMAFGLIGLIVFTALVRKIAIGSASKRLLFVGVTALGVAAGRPIWNRSVPGSVVVMVDLSPSTRGATFRDATALNQRIGELLGNQSYQLIGFADHDQELSATSKLEDIVCDHTLFSPPPTDAVLLLSDGQFSLPAYAPPTYPVIDPALDHPPDASVTDLKSIGSQVLATIKNTTPPPTPPRPLSWTNALQTPVLRYAQEPDPAAQINSQIKSYIATPTDQGEITASLPPGDLWPENDSLSLFPPPPTILEHWWVGPNAPPGWRQLGPADLPTDASAYLRPAAIVLNNISANDLSSSQQQHLFQYTRDLGGSLLLVGGDHAFAAGHYDGTLLDELSPLASSPPSPAMQWLLLIDASGSMAGDGSVRSPWQTQVSALSHLLPQLPPHDSLSIGSFAQALTWWSTGKSVLDSQHLQLPPANVFPTGPTNLTAALTQIGSDADAAMPGQLLLMTDADTDPPDPVKLTKMLSARQIHLHLLAIGSGRALPALRQVASLTHGSVIEQPDMQKWIAGATLLLRSAMPDRYQLQSATIITAPAHTVSQWNQTWAKPSATLLEITADSPMSARWQVGSGQVLAIAYPAASNHVESLSQQIAHAVTNPRFTLTWEQASQFHLMIDAIDHDRYLNGETIQLEMRPARLQDSPATVHEVPQTGPGRYELSIPSPRESQLITVRDKASVLSRFTVAGRYPSEFEAIGNDLTNLQALANRTGGRVIYPGPVQPIDFHWPIRQADLTSLLAFIAFALIGAGLVLNKRSAMKLSGSV